MQHMSSPQHFTIEKLHSFLCHHAVLFKSPLLSVAHERRCPVLQKCPRCATTYVHERTWKFDVRNFQHEADGCGKVSGLIFKAVITDVWQRCNIAALLSFRYFSIHSGARHCPELLRSASLNLVSVFQTSGSIDVSPSDKLNLTRAMV